MARNMQIDYQLPGCEAEFTEFPGSGETTFLRDNRLRVATSGIVRCAICALSEDVYLESDIDPNSIGAEGELRRMHDRKRESKERELNMKTSKYCSRICNKKAGLLS